MSAVKPKSNPTKSHINFAFEAIGTHWQIDLFTKPEQVQALSKSIAQLVANRISEFDNTYSRFRSDSWVTQIGGKPGKYNVPYDFAPLFDFYQQMYLATDGLVTPLIGDALERAGYDKKYSLRPATLKQIPKLENIIQFDGHTLQVKYKCVLDFGAAGKGYLVDIVSQLLTVQGITEFLVDAGGDMFYSPALIRSPSVNKDKKSNQLKVLLENPDFPGEKQKSIGQALLSKESPALCGSASHLRAWGKDDKTNQPAWHHIINPKELKPQNKVKASWVSAKSTMLADGLATCLFFIEPKELAKRMPKIDFDYLVIKENGEILQSKNSSVFFI